VCAQFPLAAPAAMSGLAKGPALSRRKLKPSRVKSARVFFLPSVIPSEAMNHPETTEGNRKMKTTLKTAMIALALVGLTLGSSAQAAQPDCRVLAGYKLVARPGSKTPDKVPVYVCPHANHMTTGNCGFCCKS